MSIDVAVAASASADRATLRRELTASARRLKPLGGHFRAACKAYKAHLGHDATGVLKALAALQLATHQEMTRVKKLKLSSAAGRKAQTLVVRTLVLFGAGLANLHTAFASGDAQKKQRALAAARKHVSSGNRMRRKASKALGFSWRL